MEIGFEDDGLRRLYEEPDFRLPQIGSELTRSYRKVLGFVVAATDERDLRAIASLHFEKLKADRDGQHSLRLFKGSRLIVRIEGIENDKQVVIVEVVDYH